MATYFLNYRRFVAIAAEQLCYSGEMQAVLTSGGVREGLTLRMERSHAPDPDTAREAFLAGYPEVRSAVAEKLLDFTIETVDGAALFRTPTSGKLPHGRGPQARTAAHGPARLTRRRRAARLAARPSASSGNPVVAAFSPGVMETGSVHMWSSGTPHRWTEWVIYRNQRRVCLVWSAKASSRRGLATASLHRTGTPP